MRFNPMKLQQRDRVFIKAHYRLKTANQLARILYRKAVVIQQYIDECILKVKPTGLALDMPVIPIRDL